MHSMIRTAQRAAHASVRRAAATRGLSATAARLDVTPTVEKKPEIKKFWRAVTLQENTDDYQVLLDGRTVKSPKGTPLSIPKTHPHLAHLVSAEWESQKNLLKAYSLPLTSMIVRSRDDLADEVTRKDAIDKLMKFLQTDATCYHQEFPDELVNLQNAHWVPVIEWARSRFGVEILTTQSLLGVRQPAETVATLRAHVETYTPLQLAAFERAVLTSKSFLVGLALLERAITAKQASAAASVEVEAQIARWGEVEDAHDVDREDLQRLLASVALSQV
ncbi:ATP synthase mitochondrial F1 complex assembly factor 2 [Blastocladiella emersonii ATCC 22665]|nr:ATP synthase mitochondrial F1 complex assembly factor 2 [Blastocladiella emersonii ATCC 22665]